MRRALARAAWALGAQAEQQPLAAAAGGWSQQLGARAASSTTPAAAAAPAAATQQQQQQQPAASQLGALVGVAPTDDPIMQPYYEELARMEVLPAAGLRQASDSERAAELALLRMHNMSLPRSVYEGHMIKATVLEVGRRTVTLDTGLKPARVARADLPPDALLGSTRPDSGAPRRLGELREGDVVQVYLESVGTPEGDFLVSGVQAAVQRRMAAVWNELEEKKARGEQVKGRILNQVWHGYAVGVAGIVAFLPAKQCSRPTARRIGQLQKFRILEVDRARPALLLADPNLHHNAASDAAAAHARPGGFAQKKLPRNREEAARRQELSRVADELRSVLALRSTPASGGGGAEGGSGSSGGGS